jgi:hypothetical protein
MIIGAAITKSLVWRGQEQEFSNVYHYETETLEPGRDEAILDKLVQLERTIHTNGVTFKKGRTWGPADGTAAANVTRAIKDYTGTGSLTNAGLFYREFAVLVIWPLGRYGTRNRPQYLRKWLHTLTPHGHDLNGTQPIGIVPQVMLDYISKVTVLDPTVFSDGVELCTMNGRKPIGTGKMYNYLEHRQLGR